MSAAPDGRGVLEIEDRDRVRILTLDRPDALNAFNDHLYDAVRDALLDAAGRSDLAVVVLTGRGRAFTAGQDLGELAELRRHDDGQRHGFGPFIEAVEAFPKPLIVAVNGLAVGIGLTILPHCDVVLVGESARLRAPFVSIGVTAEAGSSLALRTVPDDRLFDEALALANDIAAMPIPSLLGTKQLLLDARLAEVRSARSREDVTFGALRGGPANQEAIAAFNDRRDSDFTNLPER